MSEVLINYIVFYSMGMAVSFSITAIWLCNKFEKKLKEVNKK